MEFLLAVGLGVLLTKLYGWAFDWMIQSGRPQSFESVCAQFRTCLQTMDAGVLAIDKNATAIAVNDEFRRILQCNVLEGQSIDDLDAWISYRVKRKDVFQRIWHEWEDDFSAVGQIELEFDSSYITHALLRVFPITTKSGELVGRFIVLKDQTETSQLRSEILHASKLAAVGRMTGGIAHDFNNILMAIAANLAVLRLNEDATIASVSNELSAAEEAVRLGTATVRQLLKFSSKRELDVEPHNINNVITELSDLTKHTFDASFTFEFDLDSTTPRVLIQRSALEQVLLNLFVNARDAMPEGGVITTSTKRVHDPATNEQYALISVRDTGIGVPIELADRIFEPFFTTKEEDRGTGLGLSTSYRIIQQLGGSLTYLPCQHGGSEFQIVLPLYENAVISTTPHTTIAHRGEGRVLVVDDEDVVRSVAETVLRQHGYETLSASNGREALDCVHEHYDAVNGLGIDLVLLDLTMPGMAGREVMRHIRADYPELPIVLCSGYLVATSINGTIEGADAELQKPYSVKQLLSIVNHVLTTRRASKRKWRATAS